MMIASQPGILNRNPNRKNDGANPYEMAAAGLLQKVMAQQQQQQALYNQAAAANQQEANKGGMSISQFGKGIADLIKKNQSPTLQATPTVNINQNVPLMDQPNPMTSDQPMERYGMDTVGKMMTAEPPKSFNEMLPSLTAAAKVAYPDNPTMQQVSLTQAILESGLTGRPSELATKHNNYFGIKASRSFPGTGGTVDYSTEEYVNGSPVSMKQGFATNNSMEDSFRQHASLMSGSERYAPVMAAKSPLDAFNALGSSGYATDPNYAKKLQSIYGRYVAPMYTS